MKRLRCLSDERWMLLVMACFMATAVSCQARPQAPGKAAPSSSVARRFFAMDTAMRSAEFRNPRTAVPLLKQMGYDGIGPANLSNFPQWVEQVDKHGLQVYAVYMPINIDAAQPVVDPARVEMMKILAGRPTVVWLAVNSRKFGPSSTDGDEQAVRLIRAYADQAARHRLRISLYPHYNMYVQRIDDAIRLVKKVDRPNVGLTFNLCHWLRTEPGSDLSATLARAGRYLNMVTINGADVGGKDWRELIQPLGRGTYDVKQVLDALDAIGYRGPIGFQGFGIAGDSRQILQTTIQAWKKMTGQSGSQS